MNHKEYIVPIGEEAKEFDEMFIGVIRRQPELVRCKDCKHWQKSPTNINKHICYWGSFVKSENDFCSWGKRKEE